MGTGDVLLDRVAPLDARIRDMHELRETNCSLSLDRRCEILQDALALTDSVLLRHELMYALGQLGNKASIPFLISVLRDDKYDSVTRHEAAEALGAIGDPVDHVLGTIETMGNNTSESQELRETCYLALCRLRAIKKGCIPIRPPVEAEFVSVDPTPAHDDSSLTNEQLKEILRSHTDLWDRFRAMFALRDRGDAVSLSEVLMVDQTSALLRHEIAFVLGQMEDPRSVEALMAVMHQKHAASPEHPMVRHEVAEALGAIATPQCWEVIDQYAVPDHETSTLVRDSCIVAKDMFRYLQDWSMANR